MCGSADSQINRWWETAHAINGRKQSHAHASAHNSTQPAEHRFFVGTRHLCFECKTDDVLWLVYSLHYPQCVPIPQQGFRMGQYCCRCKKGYYSPVPDIQNKSKSLHRNNQQRIQSDFFRRQTNILLQK